MGAYGRRLKAWRIRLRQEGRWEEFLARRKELCAGKWGGAELNAGLTALRREFGYRGKDENADEDEWYLDRRAKQQREANRKYRMKKKKTDFEKSLTLLPNTAAPERELDWVSSHPAMLRLSRGDVDEEKQKVILDADDVMDSIVGQAPSKRAVIMLQHWANNPDGLQKAMVSEQKKATTSTTTDEDGTEGLDDTSDLRKLLDSMETSVKDDGLL
jgi:hypothetical protein